jgi:hypothetical protein
MFLYKKLKLLEDVLSSENEIHDSKLKSVVKNNVIKSLHTFHTSQHEEDEEDVTISHLSIDKHPTLELISRKYEEGYMIQSTIGTSCCSGISCVGYLLTKLHDWPRNVPGFTLTQFKTPKGIQYQECILCLRRKITEQYLEYVLHDKTSFTGCILPYRNNPDDYSLGCFIPSIINTKTYGISDAFVYFSLTHYMYLYKDNKNTIAHRSSQLFYQTEELPGYHTIESSENCEDHLINVGLLLDISNIIPFVLTPSLVIQKKEKYDEQYTLVDFLRKAIKHSEKKDNNFNKEEKMKYQYIINSSKNAFRCVNIYTALDRMVYYFATVWQPDFMPILNSTQQKDFITKNLVLIPLPKHLTYYIPPSLACLTCSTKNKKKDEITCSYKYDYLKNKCICKYNDAHQLIEIDYSGNLVQYKNISYLPCISCKKVMRVSSGVSIPERGLKPAKDYNKLLKKIRSVDIYTHQCVYCRYHKSLVIKCAMCNMVYNKGNKKTWQKIKVFYSTITSTIKEIYLCPSEKNVKQAAGGVDKIWCYDLLINYLKKT